MSFKLARRSLGKLKGVHPDLVAVVKRAIELTNVDFAVIEGVRTIEKQREYVSSGASSTLNSRHIPGRDGLAKAVDLAAFVGDELRWDWPLYHRIALAMKTAATELSIPLEWGGDWPLFKDGPHFQLPWKDYP